MEITKGFYDLCVPLHKDKQIMKDILKELIELDYKTIAIEEVFDHSKKDSAKKGPDIFPVPVDISFLDEFKSQIKILRRLTIVYSDLAVAHAMTNSLNLRRFNLVAGLPKSDPTLTHCCTVFNGDIITFDAEGGKLLVNRKNYQVAVKRGMYFEIRYSPVITNSNCRKDVIKLVHNYHSKGKSKNIILSSGAKSAFDLRGPYDVSNLALIFGLSEDQGKNAIGSSCRQLILRAESRRMGKTVMFVKGDGPIVMSSSSEEESSDDDEDDMDMEQGSENDEANGNKSEAESDSSVQPNKKKKIA